MSHLRRLYPRANKLFYFLLIHQEMVLCIFIQKLFVDQVQVVILMLFIVKCMIAHLIQAQVHKVLPECLLQVLCMVK